MKKKFNLIVCTMAFLALSSCGLFEDEKNSKETEGVKKTELLNKVNTLTAELNSIKADNAKLKEKVEELKSPQSFWAYVSIGAFVLGLIAFIVAFFKSKSIKEERVYDIVKKCLDDSRRIKELDVKVNQLLSSQRNNKTVYASSSSTQNFDTRLRQLEKQLAQVIETINKEPLPPVSPPSEPPHIHEEPKYQKVGYQKVGYAKVDTDLYFTKIYDSNQEGCVFKITFTDQSNGKFNIIALDKIQSRNDWQQKVECVGASIKEASNFQIEEEGVCEKIDAFSWKVIKPLKIRLLK